MARRVIETFTDDIDGSEGAVTVRFAYGAQEYEVDLGKKNADKLDKALMEFIPNARRVGKKSAVKSGGKRNDLAAVRAWANDNGHAVSERGRVPQNVIDAYDEAH
jgi:hypothetical protein